MTSHFVVSHNETDTSFMLCFVSAGRHVFWLRDWIF